MNLLNDRWNMVFFAGFLVFVWIRHVFINRAKREKKTIQRIDSLEKALLIAVFMTSLLLPVLYLFTPLLNFADYPISTPISWVGAATMIASLWLFWRAHADLGNNWSVSLEIRKNHELITNGVYRLIRHPMYSALWLWSLSQGMLLENWFAGCLLAPAFATMYFLRAPREERLMCDVFGDEYRAYMRQTGRLTPRWRSKTG